MIIDTRDDRRLEVEVTTDGRLFLCVEEMYGSCETIILDKDETIRLQSFLTEIVGEMRCVSQQPA